MKKLKIISIILLIALFITGCKFKYTEEDKEWHKQLQIQAETNATNYIKDKYNISAEVVSAEVEFNEIGIIPTITPDPTGNVYVQMKVDNKYFYVYITGEKESNIGKDNYQYEEIVNDLLNLIKEDTMVTPYSYDIIYGFGRYPGLINDYYNGNLDNIFLQDNVYNRILIYFNYIDFNNLENITFNKSQEIINNARVSLMNFATIENFNKFNREDLNFDQKYNGIGLTDEDKQNIDSILLIKYGERNFLKFED